MGEKREGGGGPLRPSAGMERPERERKRQEKGEEGGGKIDRLRASLSVHLVDGGEIEDRGGREKKGEKDRGGGKRWAYVPLTSPRRQATC